MNESHKELHEEMSIGIFNRNYLECLKISFRPKRVFKIPLYEADFFYRNEIKFQRFRNLAIKDELPSIDLRYVFEKLDGKL